MSKLQKRLLLTKVKQNRTLSLEHLFSREVKFNMAVSVATSFRTSAKSTSISHNNRTVNDPLKNDKYHKHIDWEKTDQNIILVQRPIQEVYDENFGEAVTQYNAKQKRADRQVKNYFEKVKKDKTLDLQREFIVQFGDKELCQNSSNARELFADKLVEYEKWFEQEFPDLKIYNAVIHMDEATPHLHMNVVPVAEGYKQGMTKRPSFSKFFKNYGIDFKQFREMQIKKMDELVQEMGAVRKIVGTHEYEKPSQYRETMQKADKVLSEAHAEASKLSSSASELKDEVNTLKNQKNALEGKLEGLSDKYANSSSKVSELSAKASELESDINALKNNKGVLKGELGDLKGTLEKYNKTLQKGREIDLNWRQKFVGKLKKSITGREYVEIDPKIYDEVRSAFHYHNVQSEQLHKKINDLSDDLRIARTSRSNMINENRELKQTVSELKSNVSFYKETTEGLYDRLDIATKKNKIWRDNAKKIMPKKEFKKLTRKINKLFKPFKAIATAVDIVKKVSKGISL